MSLTQALGYTVVMALIIFCCRAFPWILLAIQELVSFKKVGRAGNAGTPLSDTEKTAEAGDIPSTTDPAFGGAEERKFPSWLPFVEQTVPPTVMTILACTSIMDGLWQRPPTPWATAGAALATLVLHLWRRNALLSILGGTGLFILLGVVLGGS
ncbi:MAG: AzlD domain-containing protein [Thermanaerothrix sp.]|nr:AzlD domain-containing protein [Thermanaerothrix sp.]